MMAVKGDVGAILVEWAIDKRAFVTDLIANRVEPGIPERIGCDLYLLMRGRADLGISSRVAIGAATESVASCQGIAIIWHSSIEHRCTTGNKIGVIRAEATKGRTAICRAGIHANELIQPG